MRILLSGFEPFGGESLNPAYEAVRLVPDGCGGASIVKLLVPTSFSASLPVVEEAIESWSPDAVLCVGQAGGRFDMTVERVAINLADGSLPDNDGFQPRDEAIVPGGPAAYFSTLPVRAMADAIRARGIPASVSLSAGAFVCNRLLYGVLHLAATRFPGLRAGFVHLPYLPSQAVGKPQNTPTMALPTMVAALEAAIGAIAGS